LVVDVGAVEHGATCGSEVIGEARSRWLRQSLDEFQGCQINAIPRNSVIRKRRSQPGIGVGRRIIDCGATLSGGLENDVPLSVGPKTRRRNGERCDARKISLRGALQIGEEEELVLDNGAADRVSPLDENVLRDLRRGLEEVSRLGRAV